MTGAGIDIDETSLKYQSGDMGVYLVHAKYEDTKTG